MKLSTLLANLLFVALIGVLWAMSFNENGRSSIIKQSSATVTLNEDASESVFKARQTNTQEHAKLKVANQDENTVTPKTYIAWAEPTANIQSHIKTESITSITQKNLRELRKKTKVKKISDRKKSLKAKLALARLKRIIRQENERNKQQLVDSEIHIKNQEQAKPLAVLFAKLNQFGNSIAKKTGLSGGSSGSSNTGTTEGELTTTSTENNWFIMLLASDAPETINDFVNAYRNGDIDANNFYTTNEELFSNSEVTNRRKALLSLKYVTSSRAFSILAYGLRREPRRSKLFNEIGRELHKYSSLNRLNIPISIAKNKTKYTPLVHGVALSVLQKSLSNYRSNYKTKEQFQAAIRQLPITYQLRLKESQEILIAEGKITSTPEQQITQNP